MLSAILADMLMTDEIIASELTDPHNLKVVGHGTNGSDGIESGIHVRWAFNHKLGFPDCIRLFRRPSFLQNHYVWGYLAQGYNALFLPSTHEVLTGVYDFDFHFESTAGVNSFPIVLKTFGPKSEDVVYIKDGELRITFKMPVNRIELGFLVTPESRFQIIVDDSGESYYPQTVLGSFPGWKDIYFDANGATGLTLRGQEINLFHLAVWICSEVEANPWQEIKLTCGCGVPLIPATKPLPNEIEKITPVTDVARIDCRLALGGGSPLPFTRDDILELSELFLSIFHEGVTVPHGWTLFETETTGDPDKDETGEEATAEVSIYDYLLAQSLYVPVGKVLDLYYVDKPQNPDIYFDYRIETMWPEWNMRQLDYQITFDSYEIGQRFDNLFAIGDLYFLDAGSPEIVAAPNELARTNLGLALSDTLPVTIFRFLKPVSDVQLWLLSSDEDSEVVVSAFQDYHVTYKDKRLLQGSSGILRLHADQINSIRIEGANVILSRLHYDTEPSPYFYQNTMVCGVKRGTNPYPLEKPSGLAASFMPGGPVNSPDLTYTEVPYLAGLRWQTNEDPDKKLVPQHPFAYHIQRRLQNGPIELLTQDAPLLISPGTKEISDVNLPQGWPEERQFYLDYLDSLDPYYYRISALDLFGRQSPFSEFKSYEIEVPPPPPPTNVSAHFLDDSTYDAATDTFTDPAIGDEDKEWLRNNQTSAIVVRWQWPADLSVQAPEVDGFRIFLKEGWLNTYAGTISSAVTASTLAKSSLNLSQDELSQYPLLDTYTDIPALSFTVTTKEEADFDEDALRLCWLRQNNLSLLILSNTAGTEPTLKVLNFEEPAVTPPVEGQGISISVTAGKPAFIDYSLPKSWKKTDPLNHLEPRQTAGGPDESYTVYIEPPRFPDHPVTLNDPVRYGQIGVGAVADQVEGGVSIPATIMAIYQQPPAPPAMPAYAEMMALKATPADVHGKSTFHVRWTKSGDNVQHFVYRALDTTLFLVDNARRINGDAADYTAFDDPDYDPADVDAIREIGYVADANGALAQYADLTPGQLFILANLKENEAAYTRLHGQPIYEDDGNYQDRDTDIPDPVSGATYTPDPNLLLYADTTLDGRGSNRYFYKIKTTAANGLSSEFGESTRPVECPRTTPPPRPVITAVTGGENQITVKWAKNPGAEIAGYLLYRTQEERYAQDWRRMELVKANESDTFTVAINGNLPPNEFEFIDNSVVARQQYFYAVVAVGLSDDGKWLKSKPSAPKSGQAHDLIPPEPPLWDELIREEIDGREQITLRWHSNEKLTCMLMKREEDAYVFQSASEFLDIGTFSETGEYWVYQFVDTGNLRSNARYVYQLVAKDPGGNQSKSIISAPV